MVADVSKLVKLFDAVAPADKLPERKALAADASTDDVGQAFSTAFGEARKRVAALAEGEKRNAADGALSQIFVAAAGVGGLARLVGTPKDPSTVPAEMRQQMAYWHGRIEGLQEGLNALTGLPDNVNRDVGLINLMQLASGAVGVIQWIDAEREQLQKNETYASFDSQLALIYWPEYPLFRWQPNLLHYSFDRLAATVKHTTLMVSRLAAPTFDLAAKLVDTALLVEKTGLHGKVYLDARGMIYNPQIDARGEHREYDQSLRDLSARLQRHTKLTVVLDNKSDVFAAGECPDAALYCGWYAPGKYVDAFTWVSGAVGYHMADSEAQTLTTPGSKVWCNAMLERGVCATLGPVYTQPYTSAFPLPDDFFSLLLTGRSTLVETYYRTVPVASWVMVLVGDPLYNPFKSKPELNESDLPERLRPPSAPAASSAK